MDLHGLLTCISNAYLMDGLTLMVFGIVLVFMSIGKVAIVQADARSSPSN